MHLAPQCANIIIELLVPLNKGKITQGWQKVSHTLIFKKRCFSAQMEQFVLD